MIYVGIDNGVTGSVGWIDKVTGEYGMALTPTMERAGYQKKAKLVRVLDREALIELLGGLLGLSAVRVIMERPYTGPRRSTEISAARFDEHCTEVLERLSIPYEYVDSRQWQSKCLPHGISGSAKRKLFSLQIGSRMYPKVTDTINKRGDADGMFLAHFGAYHLYA